MWCATGWCATSSAPTLSTQASDQTRVPATRRTAAAEHRNQLASRVGVSLAVDVSSENVRAPLSRRAIADVVRHTLRSERVRHALVSVTLLSRRAIARINTTHLGRRGPTDVISFGFTRATEADPVIGDIYICPDVARQHAKVRGVGVREEVARLAIHGALHVLGYDHPEGDGRERSSMWKRQERLVQRLAAGIGR
jgi:probable rRNA maturation factor